MPRVLFVWISNFGRADSVEPTRLAPNYRCFFGHNLIISRPMARFTVLFVSLPLWGAMLQATVEFCKQNVEGTTVAAMFAWQTCKFVLQNTNYVDLRCSKFIQHKRRSPHPSLA